MKTAQTLLRLQVLGPVRAFLGSAEIDLGAPKQRAVLALLALRAGDRVPLEDLIDALWGGRPPGSAASLVHTYVARLRQALEPDMPRRGRNNIIRSVSGGYRLTIPEERLDLLLFRRLSQQATVLLPSHGWQHAFDLLGQALRAWQDPTLADLEALLPDHDEIDLLRQELIAAGLEYVTLGLEHGQTGVVLSTAERLAQVDPLNEMAQARYLQALGRTGHRAAAVARYAELYSRLRDDLGVDPSEPLNAAYREVLDAAAAEDAAPVAPATMPDRPPWRGPGPAIGEVIGRQEDLAHLLNLLNRHRLVTLSGPVGVGKTTLALSLAELARDGFADGVAVVDLSTARARFDVAAAVCCVLGLPGRSGRTNGAGANECASQGNAAGRADGAPEPVQDHLADRNLLLVFDNAELAIDETALLIDDLLRTCPWVSVVVTTRQPLGTAYEAVHRVRPLDVGRPDGNTPLEQVPAVQLFANRATQVCPEFRVTRANAPLVAAICRELDGLPLAIELAAACLRTGPLCMLLDRLEDPLHAIQPPRRGGPSHHESLLAAVRRSFEQLNTAEKHCFTTLGAISGEFCTEAARRVGQQEPGEDGDVRVMLDRLVDKSILEVREGTHGPRYRMLRTMRALAREVVGRSGQGQVAVIEPLCAVGCCCS